MPAKKKISKEATTKSAPSKGHWDIVFDNPRLRAFGIKYLVENYKDEVKTILAGGWPAGIAEPKQPKE